MFSWLNYIPFRNCLHFFKGWGACNWLDLSETRTCRVAKALPGRVESPEVHLFYLAEKKDLTLPLNHTHSMIFILFLTLKTMMERGCLETGLVENSAWTWPITQINGWATWLEEETTIHILLYTLFKKMLFCSSYSSRFPQKEVPDSFRNYIYHRLLLVVFSQCVSFR